MLQYVQQSYMLMQYMHIEKEHFYPDEIFRFSDLTKPLFLSHHLSAKVLFYYQQNSLINELAYLVICACIRILWRLQST